MCGIAGFFSKDNTKQQLAAANSCLHHRGPDAGDIYYENNNAYSIGLGHRRLAIIDISTAGNQPMHSADGRYVMIYNGEVYNYEELRNEKFTGHHWRSGSDTEVILECYAKYGPSSFEWLNGIYALAIWDKQEQSLVIARDPLGVKPLYYYANEKGVLFASELKAIKAIKPELTINNAVIPSYLHLGYIPHPWSIYQDVVKLSAGAFMKFSFSGNTIQSNYEHIFWKIQDKITPDVLKDEQSAKQQLNDLLQDAIRKQLVSDVPIGTFLSGGIDSSLVTALACKVLPTKVKTFSIAVTDGKVNEAPFAAAVAKHLGTEHYELPITKNDLLGMVPGFMQVYDEPFSDSSAFPTMLVSKLARQHVTVTLSGDGGDELFWGYGGYTWAKRLKNPLLKTFSPLIHLASRRMNSRYQRLGKLFESHDNTYFKSHLFSQDQYCFSQKDLKRLLIDPRFDFSPLNKSYTGRTLSIQEQMSFWDIENYLKDDLLVKVDRASMAYGLETRVPLLDYRVVAFALNLSPGLKVKGGVMKYLLKEVLYQYVPKPLLDRPKWGFSIPMVKWLKTDLKWLIDTYCSKEVIEQVGVVNYAEVKKIIERYQSGSDYLYRRIWNLIVLHWFLYEQR